MLACTPWEPDTGGSVTYAARIRAVSGTARMALRIRLYERVGDAPYEPVQAAGLDVWRRSRDGAAAFRYEQHVRGLRRGVVYRAVVRYRWLSSDGRVILRKRRRSPVCSQAGNLPNLRVGAVEVRPGEVEGTAVYRVRVINRGLSTAEGIGVLLRVDGEVVDEAEVIDVLQPGEARTVTLNGPVCRRRWRVVVDPKDLIAESREIDNVRTARCL